MKNSIERFKRIIRFLVTVSSSREFGFIYCLTGTIGQIAHTYFLTESISSLTGTWKVVQAVILSFFISSSLLYFVTIADNEQTKESRTIRIAVNVFMIIEILINFYYYSRHLLIDAKEVQIFDFIFATAVSCLIPVTIKLYASLIRAKEWMIEMENEGKDPINIETSIDKIQQLIDEKFTEFESNQSPVQFDEEDISNIVSNKIAELKSSILSDIDAEVVNIFEKNQNLFLNQFENKCKLVLKQQLSNKELVEKTDQ